MNARISDSRRAAGWTDDDDVRYLMLVRTVSETRRKCNRISGLRNAIDAMAVGALQFSGRFETTFDQ